MTGFPKPVRDLIVARSQGMCEICGFAVPEQIHHRRPRGSGGTRRPETNEAANGLAACSACHALVESRRTFALDRGWLVPPNHAPDHVPVVYQGNWALLTDDGAVFRPPQGHGRCVRCGCHVEKQGHRNGCQEEGA